MGGQVGREVGQILSGHLRPLGNQLPDDLHHVDRDVEHDQVAQQRVPFDRLFLLGRVVLGDHALVAEPGSRRRTRCRPRPCWWPRLPVPAAPSRRGTAAAPQSASRARPPGTPCRSGFCASSTTIGASASPKTLCIVKSPINLSVKYTSLSVNSPEP